MAADLYAARGFAPSIRIPCGARIAGAAALGLALVSAAAHLRALGHLGLFADIVSLIMAAGCVACGVHLVRHPSARAWAITATMAAAMLAVHLTAMSGSMSMSGSMAGHHRHMPSTMGAGAMSGPAMPIDPTMTVIMIATSGELVFALAALWLTTRRRAS